MPNIFSGLGGSGAGAGGAPISPMQGAFGFSSLVQGGSSILGGIQENKIEGRLSGQYEQQAREVGVQTANQINSEDYNANRLMANVRTATAASGTTQGGSAKIVNNANFTEQNLRDAYTRYSGDLQKNALQYAAGNARYQGKQAETAGFISGGTSLITGAMLAGV